MISRETENVKSSEEIESAFRALSAENKPYVTKEELYQVRNGGALQVSFSSFLSVNAREGPTVNTRSAILEFNQLQCN